jgi:hypothetical protein
LYILVLELADLLAKGPPSLISVFSLSLVVDMLV